MTDDLIKRELQAALDAWKDLAEWVRNTSKPHELGLHCAKVVRDRIEAQAAEIERLREALEHIENYYGDGHRITELARAALGETE